MSRPSQLPLNGFECNPDDRRVDVVVVGGGPAGAVTALELARRGRSVTLLERSRYESTRVGETLPPNVRRPLMDLGLWESFLAGNPCPSPGISASWGQAELYHNDFLFNPYGPGWHIDRRRFDAMLAEVAQDAGVEVMRGTRLSSVDRGRSDPWHLRIELDGRQIERRAALLVDASGRSATLARRLGGRRTVYDRLVGLVRFFSGVATKLDGDHRTLIEADREGWWYLSPLPRQRHVVAFMTDVDLISAASDAKGRFWRERFEGTSYVRTRLGASVPESGIRVLSACSSRLKSATGRDWIAVGDAASSFDPLSSQGVMWALESGQAAARTIDTHLQGNRRSFTSYVRWIHDVFESYLASRTEYYGRERRWCESSFWQRRHQFLISAAGTNASGPKSPEQEAAGTLETAIKPT